MPLPQVEQGFAKRYIPNDKPYTGLVINAKGSGVERTFCPAIFDTNGRAVYGVRNVDKTFAINHGVVSYAEGPAMWSEVGMGGSRAGNNPLYVDMVSLKVRTATPCDVIISVEDANKILAENERSGFLNNYAVIFMK